MENCAVDQLLGTPEAWKWIAGPAVPPRDWLEQWFDGEVTAAESAAEDSARERVITIRLRDDEYQRLENLAALAHMKPSTFAYRVLSQACFRLFQWWYFEGRTRVVPVDQEGDR